MPPPDNRLELWGGLECTVNRVGDRYFDQFSRAGHYEREDDLERIAEIGVKALRYPIVWERHDPSVPGSANAWEITDARLLQMRRIGIRPIVGLVHHGSGPESVCMTDSSFSDGLAAFAETVARRHPWIDAFTPVNEPLTTARFAGLYGHWHPHGMDDRTFVQAFLQECRAVVLAMEAIRNTRPDAVLVQTEDLGQTHSTPSLRYQADFENERRWATFDLLHGRIDRTHALWSYFVWAGADERQLKWFLDNPCVPDVIGVNHYLTSERWLDDRLELYPLSLHGGNGRQAYVDVEAVRTSDATLAGPESLIRQAWQRYHRPVAVTEAHLGCTREEQLRWFLEVWKAASQVRQEGADVRAVTAWSLFGSFDWDSLVTRETDFYETGPFDLRSRPPRLTSTARLIAELGRGREPTHPVLDEPGWWRRPERIIYPAPLSFAASANSSRPILITGATGTLGRAFSKLCIARGLKHCLLSRSEMDIADPASVQAALERHRPWAVINAAGYVRVDDAENDADRCRRENALGPAVVATECARKEIAFVTFSSDLVFDGVLNRPYVEDDDVAPLNTYGRCKAEAEREVLRKFPDALIVRTSAFFGPWDEHNFVYHVVRTLCGGNVFSAPHDLIVTPAYVPDLCNATLDLLIDGERGIWHIANPDALTWHDFACEAAGRAGLDPRIVEGRSAASFGWPAARPSNSALSSNRGVLLPRLSDSLDRCLRDSRGWFAI